MHKKKVMIMAVTIGLVLCTAGFTTWKVYDNYQMSKFSDLMLENLEALNHNENQKKYETWISDEVCIYTSNGKVKIGKEAYCHENLEGGACVQGCVEVIASR